MTSKEIIDGVMSSINAQIARRKKKCVELRRIADEMYDKKGVDTMNAQLQILERIEKDLIQVEMNAKISYMGIEVKGGEE